MSGLFINAAMVLPDAVRHGWLRTEGPLIAALGTGPAPSGAIVDCQGDFLLPGFVDLHTDNLERQVQPRPCARWPSRSAMLTHDAQCAAAGITTVFDSLCVGDLGFDEDRLRTCTEGVADLDALAPAGLLRADHYLHLRCELPASGMLEQFETVADHGRLRLVSLMDHTPGSGQYGDLARYHAMRLRDGEPAGEIPRRIALLQTQRARLRAPNRAALLARLAAHPVPIASHDDRTAEDVAENLACGVTISEFPVSLAAAQAARSCGMAIIAGAPNLVRGGSHTGNIAVLDLLRAGLVDALASDYVPASLVEAAFAAVALGLLDLPAAVTLISQAPAAMVGFADRGRIAAGLRADLVRVGVHQGQPVIRAVWAAGERVA